MALTAVPAAGASQSGPAVQAGGGGAANAAASAAAASTAAAALARDAIIPGDAGPVIVTLGSGQGEATATPVPYGPQLAATSAADPVLAALVPLQRAAMASQLPLAGLFANLSALANSAAAGQRPALPPGVLAAAEAILGQQLDPAALQDANGGGAVLAGAVAGSGLFAGAAPAGHLPLMDLKAAITGLIGLLADDNAVLPATISQPLDPPFRRGMPLAGQLPAEAAITAQSSDAEALALVRRDAEGALGRITLAQTATATSPHAAMVPGPDLHNEAQPPLHPGSGEAASKPPATLHMELPVRLPDGTGIMQMTVQRDDSEPEGDAAPARRAAALPAWTVRFSVDSAATGPVAAAITLKGETAGVSLAAERPETVELFRQSAPALQTALEAAGLTLDGFSIAQQAAAPAPAEESPPSSTATHVDRTL